MGQQQVALANMQELLVKVTDKCFKKCITSPGSSMGSSDQKCVAMCMDRYMDSFNLVSKAYTRFTAGDVNPTKKKSVSSQASTRYLQSFHNMLGSSPLSSQHNINS